MQDSPSLNKINAVTLKPINWSDQEASRILFPFVSAAQNLEKLRIVSDYTLRQPNFMFNVIIKENNAKLIETLYSSKLEIEIG